MAEMLSELRARLREIQDLRATADLLEWDQHTQMPSGGAPARARQLATVGRLAHARKTDPELGALIDAAAREVDGRPEDDPDVALVDIARRDYARETRVPAELVSEMKQHYAESYEVWARARPKADFAAVRPYLEKTVELSRRYAECFDDAEHVADPLIDENDRGMRAATVRELFASLREQLVPLVEDLAGRPQPDAGFLVAHFPADAQLELGRRMAQKLGYDFTRGRTDLTAHPFMTKFSIGDVRITTRVREDDFTDALFSTLHETGHALYEQNIDPALEGTPLATGTSTGVHESQSRLWENLVARSRPFWEHAYPELVETFPKQLAGIDVERFYRAINRVQRSLIRVDADEVTYNLHVMIRFDLGLQLLEGALSVADLPEAWNARYESDLGLRPPTDREGVMQDVHWYVESIGGSFQGYTLGNVMSAQFFAAARRAIGDLDDRIRNGDLAPLLAWLRDNVYRHGSILSPDQVVERATGSPLSTEDYVSYLRNKYEDVLGQPTSA